MTGPAQKSSKYGTGPPQQKKMTKYTGPTQDTKDDRVFSKQFLFIKINVHSAVSVVTEFYESVIRMVRE